MEYITFETMQELKSVGFSYPDYEHFLNYGMLFFYKGDEYFIGGFSEDSFTELDKEIAQNGTWLPETSQLLSWLTQTGFSITIKTNEKMYHEVYAKDIFNGLEYQAGGLVLVDALAKVIKKICKSQKRIYCPNPKLVIPITD